MSRRLSPPPDTARKRPQLEAPPGACDAHFHLFGPQTRFPFIDPRPLDAVDCTLEDLLALQERLGLERGVVVQTALYGTDNSCLVDALARFPQRLRGVAAVDGSGGLTWHAGWRRGSNAVLMMDSFHDQFGLSGGSPISVAGWQRHSCRE